MYFDADATNITQGTSSDDFEEFALLIALIFKIKNGRLVMKWKRTKRRSKKSIFVK